MQHDWSKEYSFKEFQLFFLGFSARFSYGFPVSAVFQAESLFGGMAFHVLEVDLVTNAASSNAWVGFEC